MNNGNGTTKIKVTAKEIRSTVLSLPSWLEFFAHLRTLSLVLIALWMVFLGVWKFVGDYVLHTMNIPTMQDIKDTNDKTDFIMLMIAMNNSDWTTEQKKVFKNQFQRGVLNVDSLAWTVFDRQ